MNVLLIIRARKRPEPDPGYDVRRIRDQVGEVIDWLPEGAWPGNEIVDNPQFRVVRVTGQAMTADIATMLVAPDMLAASDLGKGFMARAKLWQINFNLLPAAALTALKTKIPFKQRVTVWDASYSVAQVMNVWRKKTDEPRDGQGKPVDDGETLDDL